MAGAARRGMNAVAAGGTTAAAARVRVAVGGGRGTKALFGESLFDALLPPPGRASPRASMATVERYAEKCYVTLEETEPGDADEGGQRTVVVAAAGEGRGSEDVAAGLGQQLPLGRAVDNPAVASVACPTQGLGARGWYRTRPRRRPYVDLGVCTVLQDVRGHVLLTRRASHMRSFPSCWVLPGGGLDGAERMQDAARRELAEETGLALPAVSGCTRPHLPIHSTGVEADTV